MMTPETILNATVGVLERRGRVTGRFETPDGEVDQLGALAIAAGEQPRVWLSIRILDYEALDPCLRLLVDAARILAEVEAPLCRPEDLPLHRLVMLLGDSNDVATDAEVFDFLVRAADAAAGVGAAS
ncbi:hypothetical protein ACIBHX_01565 [Nonomuraea sp. NPDC050536]|uniref:DUF6197 family protein n=1 Tax=Nonomuraea sp. NPDC050536 TaxID=3364366 RepID=UPI0037CBC5C0